MIHHFDDDDLLRRQDLCSYDGFSYVFVRLENASGEMKTRRGIYISVLGHWLKLKNIQKIVNLKTPLGTKISVLKNSNSLFA